MFWQILTKEISLSQPSVPSPEPADVLLLPDFWESLLKPAASRHCPAARAMILEAAEDTFFKVVFLLSSSRSEPAAVVFPAPAELWKLRVLVTGNYLSCKLFCK